jgi:hypothetical protein
MSTKTVMIALGAMLALSIGSFINRFEDKVVDVSADQASINFSTSTQRTSLNTEQQVWQSGFFTMTVDKSNAASNIADYINPVRIYVKHETTFSFTADVESVSSIVITANSATYANVMSSATYTNATVGVSDTIVTITPTNGTLSTMVKVSSQTRWNSLVINYSLAEVEFGTLDSIAVEDAPNTTDFKTTETFNTVGLTLLATDTQSNTKVVSMGFTTDYDDKVFQKSDIGTNKVVTVSYTEGAVTRTTTYYINVTLGFAYSHDLNTMGRFTSRGNVAGNVAANREVQVHTFSDVEWTLDMISKTSLIYIGANNGSYLGSGNNHLGTALVRSELYAPSTEENLVGISSVHVNLWGTSGAEGKLSVTVGGVNLGNTQEQAYTNVNTVFEFTSATPLFGHIEIFIDNTGSTGVYLKEIKVLSDGDADDLAAINFAKELEEVDTCACTEQEYSDLLAVYNTLSTASKNRLANINLDDFNAGDIGGAVSGTQHNIVTAANKWAGILAVHGGDWPSAPSTLLGSDALNYTLLSLLSIIGFTVITGGTYYIVSRKKKIII